MMPSCVRLLLLAAYCVSFLAMVNGENAKQKQAADFLVQGLEEVEPAYATFAGKMYAGLMPIDFADDHQETTEGGFMFWLFVPDHQSVPDTMVLWLDGGPGCSSILGGVLLENSPVTIGARPTGSCCLDPNDPLIANADYSWTVATSMLYVEEPTGVGFSTGGEDPRNEHDIGVDFYGFLRNFYTVFPDLQPHRLSIFGESYAGYYVPAIAHRIGLENDRIKARTHRHKKDSASDSLLVNLDGIGIGNGWMDAIVQGPAVIDYAWWHGMIDAYTRDAFHAEWEQCYGAVVDGRSGSQEEPKPFHSFTTPDECGIMEAVLTAAGGQGVLPKGKTPNTYDVTTFDPYAVIGATNSTFHRFMNNPRVKAALHAPQEIEWFGCIPGAGRRRRRRRQLGLLDHDKPVSVVPYVAELLDRWNVRVLVYNGDFDMSTNAQGSEMLLNAMEWSGSKAWKVAGRGIWMTQNENVAGYVKKFANLTFIIVKNSGHLVPFNKPMVALDLVERFLGKTPFQDIPLPSFVLSPSHSGSRPLKSQEKLLYDVHDTISGESHATWVLAQWIGALACFLAGVVASHSWRRHGYQPVTTTTGR